MAYEPQFNTHPSGVYVKRSGAWVPWDGSASIDFTADVEIDGTSVTMYSASFNTSGDNTIVTVNAGSRIKVYRVSVSPTAAITGTITTKVGSTAIDSVSNPGTGAQFGFNVSPNFYLGADGEDLVVNLPGTTATLVSATYEIVTP